MGVALFRRGSPWWTTTARGWPGSWARKLTERFLQLVSHSLFDPHFCLVRRANEKGVVESMVRYARSNFLVPVPEVRDLEELNGHQEARCRDELARKLRGKSASKQEVLREDQAAFRALPEAPYRCLPEALGRCGFALTGAL